MSSIMRPRLITPKFVLLILVILAIAGVAMYFLVFRSATTPTYVNNEKPDDNLSEPSNNNQYTNESSNTPINYSAAQSTLNKYEGLYHDVINDGVENGGSDLWIYDNKNGSVSVEYSRFRVGGLEANNVIISDAGVADFTTQEDKPCKIIFKEGVVEIDTTLAGFEEKTSLRKVSSRIVSRRQLFEEIQKVIDSNYREIDKTIFNYEESPYYFYLYLADGCYVNGRELNVSYEGREFIRDVYIIDKEKNQLITLQDLLENSSDRIAQVDRYINGYLEIKKLEFYRKCELNGISGETWPYKRFDGVLDPYNLESKYFNINEETQDVRIKVLPYPDEARKAYGDIWIDVPFEVCFSPERCEKLKVETKRFNPEISRDIAIAYLKFIISNQGENDVSEFGDGDTNSYNLIYFDRPELAVIDKDFNYKKYSYDKDYNVYESSDFNDSYTSVREKKYTPKEIKQVFCLSSRL